MFAPADGVPARPDGPAGAADVGEAPAPGGRARDPVGAAPGLRPPGPAAGHPRRPVVDRPPLAVS